MVVPVGSTISPILSLISITRRHHVKLSVQESGRIKFITSFFNWLVGISAIVRDSGLPGIVQFGYLICFQFLLANVAESSIVGWGSVIVLNIRFLLILFLNVLRRILPICRKWTQRVCFLLTLQWRLQYLTSWRALLWVLRMLCIDRVGLTVRTFSSMVFYIFDYVFQLIIWYIVRIVFDFFQ